MGRHVPTDGVIAGADGVARCFWAGREADYCAYHDEEWGRPVADDRRLFEKICLEGFQSGLSWLTILRKRDGFRRAFRDFEIEAVARFGERDVERLLADAAIVRHRKKILSAINNAQRAREIVAAEGSLARFLWRFAPEIDRDDRLDTPAAILARTTSEAATALARDLKARGWTFVGPTTLYAFMQAVGMVNDHFPACARRGEVERLRRSFARPV